MHIESRGAGCLVAAILLCGLVHVARASEPGLRGGASIVSGLVGYTNYESELSGDRLGGGSVSFNYSRVASNRDWALGLVLRKMESDENYTDSGGDQIQVNSARLIAGIQGRWFFGRERFNAYLSPILGVHFRTTSTFTNGGDEFRNSLQSIALALSLGAMYHLPGGVFLKSEYTFHYLAKSDTIKNDHLHGIYGGIGFQFGGH